MERILRSIRVDENFQPLFDWRRCTPIVINKGKESRNIYAKPYALLAKLVQHARSKLERAICFCIRGKPEQLRDRVVCVKLSTQKHSLTNYRQLSRVDLQPVGIVRGYERRVLACLFLTITAVVAAASYDRERLEIAKQILEEVPLTDGHNDLPWNIRKFLRNQINEFELDTDLTQVEPWSKSKYSHTDLPRLRAGMVGAQFWSAFVPCGTQNRDAVQLTLEQIDVIKRLVDKYPQYLKIAISVKDILEAHSARPRKIASLIGIEGGHSIGNSLGVLRSYYQLGKVVREMNRLGMIIDLSHVGENTTRAAIRVSQAPVIFSHSSAYSLCSHNRNVPDDILQSLKENGGIIMVNFFPDFVKCAPNATLSDVAGKVRDDMRTNGVEPEEHPDSSNDNGNCTSNAFYADFV
ncbi:unnamed protein product [Leptidea sinapis]|uniref:Dipeptidase n=1 Tax=Leptidea sinapis TaxID=189913 RepID=A0A5E4PJY6_9NEOP|nr:unnamed protein product [Leptidea sinapis]